MPQALQFPPDLPGGDIVASGLADLSQGRLDSIDALLVSGAATRLRTAGIHVPRGDPEPEHALYAVLQDIEGDGAHTRYTALRRRVASFASALEHARAR